MNATVSGLLFGSLGLLLGLLVGYRIRSAELDAHDVEDWGPIDNATWGSTGAHAIVRREDRP